jgi:transcriptional regulator with XRE-family HTH domain
MGIAMTTELNILVRLLKENKKQIGTRIQQTRKSVNKTQKWLSEQAGVLPQQIQKYEAGIDALRPETLERIAIALGCSTSYLLTGEGISKNLLPSDYSSRVSGLGAKLLRGLKRIPDKDPVRRDFLIFATILGAADWQAALASLKSKAHEDVMDINLLALIEGISSRLDKTALSKLIAKIGAKYPAPKL